MTRSNRKSSCQLFSVEGVTRKAEHQNAYKYFTRRFLEFFFFKKSVHRNQFKYFADKISKKISVAEFLATEKMR